MNIDLKRLWPHCELFNKRTEYPLAFHYILQVPEVNVDLHVAKSDLPSENVEQFSGLQICNSAGGSSKNLSMDEIIQDLLRKQVLIPRLEKSEGTPTPPATLIPPPLHSTTETMEIDSKSTNKKENGGPLTPESTEDIDIVSEEFSASQKVM